MLREFHGFKSGFVKREDRRLEDLGINTTAEDNEDYLYIDLDQIESFWRSSGEIEATEVTSKSGEDYRFHISLEDFISVLSDHNYRTHRSE